MRPVGAITRARRGRVLAAARKSRPLDPPPDRFWTRCRSASRHDPGPQTSTAAGPGSAADQLPRRVAHGPADGRVEDPLMNHRRSLSTPSGHGPQTALTVGSRIASAFQRAVRRAIAART